MGHRASPNGMTLHDSDVIECSFSVESASEATHYLVKRGPVPDAVVCLNDLLAIISWD